MPDQQPALEKAQNAVPTPPSTETAVQKTSNATDTKEDENAASEKKSPHVFNEQTNYVPKRVIITVSVLSSSCICIY